MSRSKDPSYNNVSLLAVRAISILSCIIISSILGFFVHALLTDKFKIPWTFIIVLLAAIVNLVVIGLTSIINCCATLSPILNLLLNIPVMIIWIVGTALLTWNLYGALGHSCSLANWGNSRGVMVCNVYKTLYSFVIFAGLAHVAQLVLDVRARQRQVRLGKYGKMRDSRDVKVDDLKPLAPNTIHEQPLASESSLPQFSDEQYQQPQHQPEFRDETQGWRPGQKQPTAHSQSYTSSVSNSNYGRNRDDQDYYYGHDNGSSVHMQDLSYQRPQPTTYHDSDSYNSSYGYGYNNSNSNHTHHQQRQEAYYQGRY